MMSADEPKSLVYTVRLPIRWGDMDAIGHVNNTVYFRFMEQARIEWFSQLSCLPDERGHGPVIINAHCTFLKPLKYPDTVEVRMYLGAMGRSSVETICEMCSVQDGLKVYAHGGAKVVWVDPINEKSVQLPDAIVKFLA